VEHRREVLELAPPGTLLEHAAAVGADAVLGAVVVGVEQGPHAAEASGLQIEHPRLPRQGLDVRDRAYRLVPGDPIAVAFEQVRGAVFDRRILDPGVGQPLDHPAVQADLRLHGDREVAVGALHVDDLHAAQAREL